MEADVPHPVVMLVTMNTSLERRGGREVALWLFHGWQMWHVQAGLLPWGLELSSCMSCCVPLGRGGCSEGGVCAPDLPWHCFVPMEARGRELCPC